MPNRRILVMLIAAILGTAISCKENTVKHDEMDKIFIEAQRLAASEPAKSLELLHQVIEAKPHYYAYYIRGWIYARQNEDGKAKADVGEGLKLFPEDPGLKWLQGELKKPAAQRKLDMPPSFTK